MRALVIGSGAREHALTWRLRRDGHEARCAPGNGGTGPDSAHIDVADPEAIAALASEWAADLVVVGPEAPLVAGAVDALRSRGIAAFGPGRAAAQLEGSKAFSKEFMARHGVPTAEFGVFDDPDKARAYVRSVGHRVVIKADGLAAGKGVIVAADVAEAEQAITHIMDEQAFGAAGGRVVVEACLSGQEVSYHVIADGERYLALAPAQDHKRALDGDRGPNTGGMGAYSPPPVFTTAVERRVRAEIVEPTLRGMAAEGMPYTGALFIGLMIDDGVPQVLEFNVRFGDPECEALMTRLRGDVGALLHGAATAALPGGEPLWDAPASLCVVLASEGYPGAYPKGREIRGLDDAGRVPGVTIFHAGTRRDGERLVTSGGRVLTVTAVGGTLDEAAERAYRAADLITFEGKQLRRDIGHHARSGFRAS